MIFTIIPLIVSLTLVVSAPHDQQQYSFIYPPYDPSTHHVRTKEPHQELFANEYGTDTSRCKRNATCVPVNNATCLGVPLSYDSTSLDLVPAGYVTPSLIKQQLRILQGLRSIPKCWSVVRPFVCSLFMPKCENNTVERLSQGMCRNVLISCRLVLNETIWPQFINCDDEDLFLPECFNTNIFNKSFNRTWRCPAPLVPLPLEPNANGGSSTFDGIDGCGVPCKDPMYTDEEREQIRRFIAWGAGVCCVLNSFAVVTFLIDWRSARKFPASVIFYINGCFMVCCLGWLVQFLADNSDVVVCRRDGTLRRNEPNGDLACVLIFILVYYPIAAALTWFVILTYSWHSTMRSYGKISNRLEKNSAYFHLLAWCLPLMLTVAVMGMSEVDGDSMTGICFVGRYNYATRMGFVLGPVGVAMTVGGYFLLRGLTMLIRLAISSEGVVSEKVRDKMRSNIVRIGLFSVSVIIAVAITVHCHMYDFKNYEEWQRSFRNFIICSITTHFVEPSTCRIESRPSVTKLQLHLFALFFSGVVMSSWVWTSASVNIWLRCVKHYYNLSSRIFTHTLIWLYRLFNRDSSDSEPVKMKKHEVIAQAYSKRKMLEENGRISITCPNEDPVGLNFNPNSVTSQDFSATWAAALPHLVERRGALVGSTATTRRDSEDSRFSNRRSSNDSKYSFSMRKVSLTSRRNSGDSQFAVSINEVTARGQLPYRVVRDEDEGVSKRRKRRVKEKHRGVRGYKVKSRRTGRGYLGNSQDTPAVDTDY